jgi:hypothetical protein
MSELRENIMNISKNENRIEKNLFYMDEKGNIVNYLMNPPNLLESKDDLVKLITTLDSNKVAQV